MLAAFHYSAKPPLDVVQTVDLRLLVIIQFEDVVENTCVVGGQFFFQRFVK